MEPVIVAVLPVRSQTSRATSGVNRSPAGRPISFNVSFTLAFRNQVEKRGLLQLDREPLLQRVIENRVAGGVGEVGQDDGVFVSELGRTVRDRSTRQPALL